MAGLRSDASPALDLCTSQVLRAIHRRGMSLRDAFTLLDTDGSGELDADEFIDGILREFDGQFSPEQVTRLMELTDADNSGPRLRTPCVTKLRASRGCLWAAALVWHLIPVRCATPRLAAGSIDFSELTRALKKTDLRIEVRVAPTPPECASATVPVWPCVRDLTAPLSYHALYEMADDNPPLGAHVPTPSHPLTRASLLRLRPSWPRASTSLSPR